MTKVIVLSNHISKIERVIAHFTSFNEAHSYVEEFIESYIYEQQGNRAPVIFTPVDLNISYGYYAKCSKLHVFRWTVKEMRRALGYLYNSYELVKHFTISIAEMPASLPHNGVVKSLLIHSLPNLKIPNQTIVKKETSEMDDVLDELIEYFEINNIRQDIDDC